jgi:ADP-ribose pyrophosphatase YjhB (NUDIX family)
MKTRTSYGIALCRYNKEKNNAIEILLIKKRYSYYYLTFVMGYYKKGDLKYLKYLFDNMSYSEKIDILSMQYSQMWYRIWLNNPEKYYNIIDVYKDTNFSKYPLEGKFSASEIYKNYICLKNRFEKNFLKDDGHLLQSLIQKSTDAEVLWEIPKGSKNHVHGNSYEVLPETNIDCAMREFFEETSIKNDKYKVLYDVEPIIESFIDNDIIYKMVYYIAEIRKDTPPFTPHIDYRNFDQVTEVEQIKWTSLPEINFFCLSKTLHNRLIKLYTNIIKSYKKSNKKKYLK